MVTIYHALINGSEFETRLFYKNKGEALLSALDNLRLSTHMDLGKARLVSDAFDKAVYEILGYEDDLDFENPIVERFMVTILTCYLMD